MSQSQSAAAPRSAPVSANVPEISLSAFSRADEQERQASGTVLFEGLKRFGFIVLKDHGISRDLLARSYDLLADFFARPLEEKLRYDSGDGGQRGYTAFGREHAKDSTAPDLKEFWHLGRELPPGHPLTGRYPPNFWPDAPANFRETFLDLYTALEQAGHCMLTALAPSLDLSPDYFREMATDGNSISAAFALSTHRR